MLPKQNRINSRGGFKYIFSNGIRVKGTYGVLFASAPKERGIGNYRFGFTIPKKVGGAVERNLMKRRLSDIVAKWIKLHEVDKLPSFNAAYLAHKFAESYEDLENELISQCDKIST